ncbi:unnamed protein product, partial [marine sediment metagenome]
LQFMYDVLYKYKVAPPGSLQYTMDENATLFLQGKVAMTSSHCYVLTLVDNPEMSQVIGKWGVFARPGMSNAATWHCGMPEDAKDKKAAFRFAQYVTNKENLMKLAMAGIPTTRVSIMTSPEILRNNPGFEAVIEVLKRARPDPPLPEWKEVQDFLVRACSEVFAGEKTTQQGLDDAAKEIRILLEQRGYYR